MNQFQVVDEFLNESIQTPRHGEMWAYILKRNTDLAANLWAEINRIDTLTNDSSLTLSDPNPPVSRCFYQVEVLLH